MDIELVSGISAVLLIIGLVSLAKAIGFPSKYGTVLAIALGLAASFGYTYFRETEWFVALIMGLGLGLTASGLYSGTKNALGK